MKRVNIKLAATLAAFSATGAVYANEAANTSFINSLNYDRNLLLAITLEPTSQAATPGRLKRASAVVICTSEPQDAVATPNENALLDPSGGVIFPGAIIRMDQQLARGTPTPYTLPRAPLKIRLDFPACGDRCTRVIDNPTNVSVPQAVEGVVRAIGGIPNQQVAARAFYSATKYYSKSQVAVDLGFSAQWTNNTASGSMAVSNLAEQTIIIKAFKQVYYTAIAEAPTTAGSVFGNTVSLSPANMNAGGPPGFVSSVDYGRIIVVQMTTNSAVTSVDAKAAMDYATGGTTVSATAKAKYDSIVNNSEFRVLVLGGNAGDTAELFKGSGNGVAAVIAKGLPFSLNSPAFPISYKVQDLKTRELATIKLTTRYVKSECQEFANGYVDLKLTGGFVGKFDVKWKEASDNGRTMVDKSYASGNKTAGWSTRVWLPGDAKDITITGDHATGLAWEPRRTSLNERPSAVPNKCYVYGGTTLNAKVTTQTSCL